MRQCVNRRNSLCGWVRARTRVCVRTYALTHIIQMSQWVRTTPCFDAVYLRVKHKRIECTTYSLMYAIDVQGTVACFASINIFSI